MKRFILHALCVGASCFLVGCGGNSTRPPPALIISSGSPPSANVRVAYGAAGAGFSLTASGGQPPYKWSWVAGNGSSLPAGLTVATKTDGTGLISGTPTTAGSYNVVVTVADSQSPPAKNSANYSIVVSPPPLAVTSGAPPVGVVGDSYGGLRSACEIFVITLCASYTGFPLTATGGVGPYTWSWSAAQGSTLPPGLDAIVLRLNGDPGGIPPIVVPVISGKPVAKGTYDVIVTVKDSSAPPLQANANYTIIVENPPPPSINTTPDPFAGAVNLHYSFTFTATDGLPPLTWTETAGVPPGLTFSASGVLSGVPTVTGSFPITLVAQDSLGQNSAAQNFTIEVFPHGFKATGAMVTPRVLPTATLLPSGKVLVAGGDNKGSVLNTVELFDPSTGTFALTGDMTNARIGHTATLLPSGKVLMFGGTNNSCGVLTAELFDPSSGSFSTLGNLPAPRAGHTATLLNDGRVLIVGGGDATTLVFDPSNGTFTPAGNLNTARSGHTATLLKSGKVLVTGGADSETLMTAEVFDPSTVAFVSTGTMTEARTSHTSTLLSDGRALVAGGDGALLAFTPLMSAELFDPIAGTFSATGSLSTKRVEHTATLLPSNQVLVVGGVGGSGASWITLASAELFDSGSGTFSLTGSMASPRQGHVATLLQDGTVLVTGGVDAKGVLVPIAEVYQ